MNLNSEDILDYLMTSDFNEDLSPDELKELLKKFRYYFRIVSTKQNNIDLDRKKFESEIEELRKNKQTEIDYLNNKLNDLFEIYDLMTTRKLTFKERFFGRLRPKKNEIPKNN